MAPLLKAEVRQQIIALWETGLRHMDISKRLGISRTTVYFWIKRYEQEGAIIKRKRQNYPRATTAKQDQEIVEARLMDNSSKTLACLYSVSPRTIRRRLNQAGMALSAVGKRKKSRKVRSKTVKSGPPHSEVKRRSKRTKTNVHSAETDTQISDVSMAEDGGTSGDEDGVAEPLTLDVDAGESDLEPAAVPLEATSQDKESDPLCTDDGSHCSGCGDVLTGFRYVCVQCAAFELCAACEAAGGHGLHYALRVPRGRPQEEIAAMLKKIREELCKHKIPVEGIIKDEMDVEPEPLGVVEGTEISPEEAADFQPINVESQMAVEGTDCQTTSDVSNKGRQTLMKESLNMIYDNVIIHETPQSERNESSSMKNNNATSHETPQSEINESTSIKHNNANRHEISQSEKNECPSVNHNNATSHESPQTEINESLSMKHNNEPSHGTPPPERNKSPSMKHNDAPCHKTQQSERNESPSMKQNHAPSHGTPQPERNKSPSMKHNDAPCHKTPQSERNESPSMKHNNANRHEIPQSEKNECPSLKNNNATSHESLQTERNKSPSMKHNNAPSHGTPQSEINESPSMKHNNAPSHGTPQSERNKSLSMKRKYALSQKFSLSEIKKFLRMKHNAPSHINPQSKIKELLRMNHNNAPNHETPQSQIKEALRMKHNALNDKCLQPQIKFLKMILPTQATRQSNSVAQNDKDIVDATPEVTDIEKDLDDSEEDLDDSEEEADSETVLITEPPSSKLNAMSTNIMCPSLPQISTNSVASNDKDVVDAASVVTDIENDGDEREEAANSKMVMITEPSSSKLNAMSTNTICPSIPQTASNSVASNDEDVIDAAPEVTDIKEELDDSDEESDGEMIMITEPPSSKLMAMSTNIICPNILQPVLVMRNFTPAPGARYVLLSGPQPVGGVSALGPAIVAPRIVQRGASNTQLSRPN